MLFPYEDDVPRFCVTFTQAVITWNNAEDAARRILASISKGGIGALVAITHLGSAGLKDAMLTIANFMDDPETPYAKEVADHVRHLITGMDILRGYRNYYVHSLHAMGHNEDEPKAFTGLLYATEAKGRYAFIKDELTIDELERFMEHCLALKTYGEGIASYVAVENALAPARKRTPLASLERPTWPETVKKPRSYLGGH